MKKIFIVLLFLLCIAAPAFSGDMGSFGITGGYTSKDNTALMGFNGTYQYTAPVSDHIGIGFGSHADFAFGLNHENELTLFFGSMIGLGMGADITDRFSLNVSLGPAITAETGIITSSVGIGLGIDTSVSYFFDEYKSVAFNAGVTAYPQFLVLDDGRNSNFSFAILGYIGLSFRYPSPVTAIALPVIDYILF